MKYVSVGDILCITHGLKNRLCVQWAHIHIPWRVFYGHMNYFGEDGEFKCQFSIVYHLVWELTEPLTVLIN